MEYYKNSDLASIRYVNDDGVDELERWKDIPGYIGIYEVSDLARVKRLGRFVRRKNSGFIIKEKILKQNVGKRGYLVCGTLGENRAIHQLVAMAFMNHTPCGYIIIVDHINNDKLNCRPSNLQMITQRDNASKDRKNKSSKYIGVSWVKSNKKWISAIRIKGVKIALYNGIDEEKAHEFYIKAKENIHLYNGDVKNFQKRIGVAFVKYKLTEQNVLAIRRLHKINPNFCRETIEKKFNIHKATLHDVLIYKNWKHVA